MKLLVARDGGLWIGTSNGLARWKDETLQRFPELADRYVFSLLEDHDGVVWAGTDGGPGGSLKLCSIQAGRVKCGDTSEALGQFVISLQEDSNGHLWVGASTGLWRWTPSPAISFPLRDPFPEVRAIVAADNGEVLIASNRQLSRATGSRLEDYPLQLDGRQLKPTALLRDRNGALWIGTEDQGLVHVHNGRVDRFDRTDGLSGDFISTLLEDREGNVWVATLNGIDRFRAVAVTRFSKRQGLSSESVLSVLAVSDGSALVQHH